MSRSEIFESFVKIAQKQGLISEGEHAEHTEKDFHETNPRHDSLTIEQIGKLYGVKPDRPEDMDYKKNIMEDAHPDSVVLSPSHDKLNGLVENNNERQNIMIRIVQKEPDGHLTQRKYARKQLLLSLVRIGNELDNRGQDELRKLADTCLEQAADKKIHKNAQLVEIGVAAAIIGALYAYEHITTQEGLRLDYGKLKSEIDELKSEHTVLGFGYEFSDEFNRFLDALDKAETQIFSAAQALQDSVGKLSNLSLEQKTSTTSLSGSPEGKAVAQAYENLKKIVEASGPFFEQVHRNLNDSSFRERAIKETGAVTGLIDKLKIFHSTQSEWGLFGNFFQKLNQVVANFEDDVKKLKLSVEAGERAQSQAQSVASSELPSLTPNAPAEKPEEKKSTSPFSFLEGGEGGGILGGLSGLFGK